MLKACQRKIRAWTYIAKSPDFARPILNHIRQLVHTTCPQAQETVKWRMPHFEHKGIICGMAAFKQHCRLFFWKRALIFGKGQTQDSPQGQLGNLTFGTNGQNLPSLKP